MAFQKKNPLRSLFSSKKPAKKPNGGRRSLNIESLEAREMLAVSILSAPITAYAQVDNPAEIRFDIKTDGNATTKVDFTAKQAVGSTLDPSKMTLVNLATGQAVTLTNIVDGITSGSASAFLKTGSYSLIVAADSGKGNFTLDILQEKGTSSVKSGLDILVAAAISQQQAGWSYRIAHYNALLLGTDYAGAAGMKPIATLYPEVDVNGDGKVDVNDLTLAEQLISGNGATATVTTHTVVSQDLTAPTITVGLKNDTGTPGDRISTDPTIVGRVTDSSGLKSAQYKVDNGSWVSLSPDASGNYTIANTGLSAGKHTITVTATDTKGNTSTSTCTFTVVTASQPGNVTGSAVTAGGSGTAKFPSTSTVQSVNGSAISAGKTVTLADNKGTVSLAADGTLTFTPGSSYTKLAQGEKETIALSVVSKDANGHTFTSTVSFTVTGKNELPTLSDTTPPNLNVNENASGTIVNSTLLGKWTDVDNNASLSIASTSVYSASCSNTTLNGKYTASALSGYVTVTSTGVKLDATSSFFDALGAGETLTITVAYKVKDQYGTSGDTGYLTFTVIGQNDAPVFTAGTTTFGGIVSNDTASPLKSINPGFAAADTDYKDSSGLKYSYSNVKDGSAAAASGLITGFDASTGKFQIDTSKLANRNTATTVTLTVTVGAASGGTASKTLTINLAPQTVAPTVPTITATVAESQSASKAAVPTVQGNGYTISGLKVVSGAGYGSLPSGVSLNSIVSLGKNSDGSIGFTFNPGTNFEYLQAGETLKLKFQYTLTDTQYNLTGTGTIELTITGKASAAVPPTGGVGAIGNGGEFTTTETGGNAPAVTVPKDTILGGWTLPDGDSAYSIVPGTVKFDSWTGNSTYSATTNPLGTNAFGSVNVDASGNLVFTPNAAAFAPLGKGQYVDLTVDVQLRDAAGNLVPGGTVTIRVNGSNDNPELTWRQDSGFSFASNSKTAVSIDPGFTKNDVDLNDAAATLVYDIDQVSKDRGFSIGNDGVINIGNGNLAALNGTYTVTVILRDNNGGSTSKDITVGFYKEAGPALSGTSLTVGEKDASVSSNLNNSMTKKPGHTYSFSQSPTPTHYSTDGTTWKSLSDGVYDLTGCWTFDSSTGAFTFSPSGKFNGLTSNESLYFKFEYKVSDDGYNNCESTGSIAVQISGVNDLPTHLAGTPAQTKTVTESASAPPEKIENLLSDWTDADHANSELKISTLEITAKSGSTLITLSALQAAASGFLKITDNGRTIEVDPSNEIFRRLGLGENITLTIRYTVVDPKGGSGTAEFTLTVNGSNDPPSLVFGDDIWMIRETDASATFDLTPYLVDYDANDAHYIVMINGEAVTTGWSKTLDNGATLKYLGDLKIQYVLNGKFEYLSQGRSAFDGIDISITDGDTTSATATLQIEIQGVHTPIRLVSDATVTKTVDVTAIGGTGCVGTIEVWKDSNDTLKYTVLCTGSDGNSYDNLFTVDGDGDLCLDPSKIGSLNKNLTYTVAVTIENADFADTALSVTYTLDFVHRAAPVVSDGTLTVSQNDAEKSKSLAETHAPADGYSHAVTLITNTSEVALVAGTDYTVENGVFKFLAGSRFAYLQTGEAETLEFTYRITDTTQGNGSYYAEATLTVTVEGANDAPVFTAPPLIEALDGTATEILWKEFFSDADRNDTLTLTGINGTNFDLDGKVAVAGIGTFYLDGDEKLWFTSEAAFETMKKDVLSDVLAVTLNVKDGRNAVASSPAIISLQVKGTNKPPVIAVTDVPNKSVKETIVFTAAGIAADLNGDALYFDSIMIEGEQIIDDANWNADKNAWIYTLATGTTLTVGDDKTTLTVDGTLRNDFLTSGSAEDFSFDIIVADVHGDLSAEGTITTALEGVPATAPAVTEHAVTGVTEDDAVPPAAVDLADYISDTNIPCRNNAGGWYTIDWNGISTAKIGNADLDGTRLAQLLADNLWKYENGVLTFEKAPAGYFDFLNENEVLTLIFTYTVTDKQLKDESNGDLVSTGTIVVEISGVNDLPTIEGVGNLNDTLSIAPGADIAVGKYQGKDLDDRDTVTVTIGDVTGMKGDEVLTTLPTFVLLPDGSLKTTNMNMPELAPGEFAVFTVELIATDTFGGQSTKTVTLTLYAKNLAEIDIADSELNATEDDIDKSTPITVTDVEDAFRTDTRTGNDWYDKPNIDAVTVPESFADEITDPASFFSVVGDETTGYSLKFTGTKDDFAFLREGEKLVFTVTVSVADGTYSSTTTETVTVTVTGVGDAHTVDDHIGTFDGYWANQRKDRPTEFDPACNIDDADWKSTYGYTLQNIAVDSLPEGFDLAALKALISVDAETGKITLDETGLAGLTVGFKYTLTIRVASAGDYADTSYVDVVVELNINSAGTPAVDPVGIAIAENGDDSVEIVVNKPSDGATRHETDWYTISEPTLKDFDFSYTGTLPDGFDWNTVLAGLATIENGFFNFDTNSMLDFLPEGETLVLTYEFTVADKVFDTFTKQVATVTITGKNNQGTAKTGHTVDGVHEIGSSADHEVFVADLADLVRDVDLGDSHTIVSIDGFSIVYNTWTKIPGKGEFYYYGGTLGSDDLYYGGSLKYRPSAPELESLRHGVEMPLTFDFLLKDDSGAANATTTTGHFTITVAGTNKMPVVNTGEQRSVDEGDKIVIKASDIAGDVNGDTLRIYKVNGHTEDFQLADGTTIRFLDGGLSIEIDTKTRDPNLNMLPLDSVLHTLSIVVADDSGAENFYSLAKPLTVTINAIDDAPGMPESHRFGVSIDNVGEMQNIKVGYIDFFDPDTDRSLYDFKFVYDGEDLGFAFSKLESDLVFFTYYSSMFEEKTYSFEIVATLKSDESVTCKTTVFVTLSKKLAPSVEVDYETGTKLSLAEDADSGSVGITVGDPNGEKIGNGWYTIENVRYMGDSFASLPPDVNFEYVNGRFVFTGNGAFESLKAGETATLVFEFSVRNTEYGIDTTKTVTIEIAGKNSVPVASDYQAMLNIPDNTQDGVRFYLKNLAADADAGDTLRFDTVGGGPIALNGPAVTVYKDGIVLGFVHYKSDENGEHYLLFYPNGYFGTLRFGETEQASFLYTVVDSSGAVSNEASVSVGVVGTNKSPVIKTVTGTTPENKPYEITAAEIATDTNRGDSLRITGIRYNGTPYWITDRNQEPIVLTLDSGAVLTLHADGRLLYDPANRTVNLGLGMSETEQFELIVADDSGDVSSCLSSWKNFSLQVTGVNEAPVDVLPDVAEYVTTLNENVQELRIDLSKHFDDADFGDELTFSIKEEFLSFGFLTARPVIDGHTLILKVMKLGDYSNDFDFSAIQLTILVDDGHVDEPVEKVLTFRVEQQQTVRLDVIARETASPTAPGETGTKPAAETLQIDDNGEYYVEVWASDLINSVIEAGMSAGLDSVSFSIYWTNPKLCEILEYAGIGTVEKNDIGIAVTITGLASGTGVDGNDLLLLRMKVKAVGTAGMVGFSIDPTTVEINRNGGDNGEIHASQIDAGTVTVTHLGSPDSDTPPLIVSFTAPTVTEAFAMLHTWTSEDELTTSQRNRVLDALLETIDFDSDELWNDDDAKRSEEESDDVYDSIFDDVVTELY